MEHSPPGESIRSSPSQEISRIIRNRHVQYHGHQSTPPVPVLSQIKPGHPTQYFLNIYLHTTYPSKPKSFKWLFSSRFPTKGLHAFLFSPLRATCSLDHPIIWRGRNHEALSSLLLLLPHKPEYLP